MKQTKIGLKIFIFIGVIVVGTVLGACTQQDQSTNSILTQWNADIMNSKLPNLTLPSLDGQNISITETLAGKFGIISIWSSTCHFCQEDIPKLVTLTKTFKSNNNFKILYVSSDTDRRAALKFAKDFNITGLVLHDPKITQLKKTNLSTSGTPTLFVVSPESKIVARIVGGRNWDNAKVKKQMKVLLDTL